MCNSRFEMLFLCQKSGLTHFPVLVCHSAILPARQPIKNTHVSHPVFSHPPRNFSCSPLKRSAGVFRVCPSCGAGLWSAVKCSVLPWNVSMPNSIERLHSGRLPGSPVSGQRCSSRQITAQPWRMHLRGPSEGFPGSSGSCRILVSWEVLSLLSPLPPRLSHGVLHLRFSLARESDSIVQ